VETELKKSDVTKASAREISSLARYRRQENITLQAISIRIGKSLSWTHNALAGHLFLTRYDVRSIREAIQELSR
jgi:hypothetical protein